MAKETDKRRGPGPGMDKQTLRRGLARARRGTMSAAIGQGDPKSGGRGLVLLDKVMPPKQLMKALREQFPTGVRFCFGTVSVGSEADPKLVTFHMNKRVPGLDRRLRKALKPAGYSNVAIQTGKPET